MATFESILEDESAKQGWDVDSQRFLLLTYLAHCDEDRAGPTGAMRRATCTTSDFKKFLERAAAGAGSLRSSLRSKGKKTFANPFPSLKRERELARQHKEDGGRELFQA